MLTLYYSRAACSLAPHIALEEAQVPFAVQEVSLDRGEQRTPEYRRINPLGRVPALQLEGGAVLTEVPALLGYIASLAPERRLLPDDPLARARAAEWMSLLASSVHVAFGAFRVPARFTDDPGAQKALSGDALGRFFQMLQFVENRLPDGGQVLPGGYSLCDAYALVFFLWGRQFDLPVSSLPRYRLLARTVLERPATQRALAREGVSAGVGESKGL